jgi:hypothetical protein
MRSRTVLPLLLGLSPLVGCTDDGDGSPLNPSPSALLSASPPASIVWIDVGGTSRGIWPYTGTSFSGQAQDPANLIFVGDADVRNIRSALLSLDGNRNVAPFSLTAEGQLLAGLAQSCTWTDAFGDNQVSYSVDGGWAGSVVQLECGHYNNFRYHLRLFPAGPVTLGNVHAEVIVPGTQAHEVLTWEAGEKFVMMELVRGGLLASAPGESPVINEVGSFKTIMPMIYNGLPTALRMLSGGPLAGTVTNPVPVLTDGRATILDLQTAPPAGGSTNAFEIMFGQVVPKPFCASTGELVRLDGPVQVTHTVDVGRRGALRSRGVAKGRIAVRSFDPATGALGAPQYAQVEQEVETEAEAGSHRATTRSDQRLILSSGGTESFALRLRVGSGGETYFSAGQSCGS